MIFAYFASNGLLTLYLSCECDVYMVALILIISVVKGFGVLGHPSVVAGAGDCRMDWKVTMC